jgi:acylphosphatase
MRKRVVVAGQVQGVFFRDTCRRVAAEHGVRGWVRNLRDGRVEAAFEGPPEAVSRLVDWARRGPSAAVVRTVDVHDEDPEHLRGFEVRPTP